MQILKSELYTTTYLLEGIKLKRLFIPMVGEEVEEQNSYALLKRM